MSEHVCTPGCHNPCLLERNERHATRIPRDSGLGICDVAGPLGSGPHQQSKDCKNWRPLSGAHKPGSDAALFEIIAEDEVNRCPPGCNAPLERCTQPAVVRATTSSGYERRPLCSGHAHVIFAEWMMGL
jgi:hypothetical protein